MITVTQDGHVFHATVEGLAGQWAGNTAKEAMESLVSWLERSVKTTDKELLRLFNSHCRSQSKTLRSYLEDLDKAGTR